MVFCYILVEHVHCPMVISHDLGFKKKYILSIYTNSWLDYDVDHEIPRPKVWNNMLEIVAKGNQKFETSSNMEGL